MDGRPELIERVGGFHGQGLRERAVPSGAGIEDHIGGPGVADCRDQLLVTGDLEAYPGVHRAALAGELVVEGGGARRS